ncbi:uncharacterized protein LOC108339180 [Vigna angularis]|uniref:uncharacterized protein LOC108339180 n=1 Tax=Phaseolus angularis TaxID=3914 RepID=UPI00080A3263|nr:uncharacterized protein LOC108339180 [Vigna angularis]
MSDFDIEVVFHHRGKFLNDGSFRYHGGDTSTLVVDIDRWSYFEILAILREMRYINVKELWYSLGGCVLEDRLELLSDDIRAMHIVSIALLNGKAHLFVVHMVSELDYINMLQYDVAEQGEDGEDSEGQGEGGEDSEVGEVGEDGEGADDGEVGDVGDDGHWTEDGLFVEVGEDGQGADDGEVGEVGDVGEVGEEGEGGDDGEVGQVGDVVEVGEDGEGADDGEVGQVGDVGEVGEEGKGVNDGEVGQVGEDGEGVDDVGEVGEIGEDGEGAEDAEVGDVSEVGHETKGVEDMQEEFDVSSWIRSDEEAFVSEDEFVDVGVHDDEQLEQQDCEGSVFVEMGTGNGCTTSNWSGLQVFEINHACNIVEKFVVDVDKRDCSCRKWTVTGIPCCDALTAMRFLNINPEDYIPNWFRTSTYEETYIALIFHMNGPEQWQKTSYANVLPPPNRVYPGRPRKNGRLESWEQKRDDTQLRQTGIPKRCGICRQLGHKITNCPQAQHQQATTHSTQPSEQQDHEATPLPTQASQITQEPQTDHTTTTL